MIFGKSGIKILIGTPLHIQGENSCSKLYWSGSSVTKLCRYLVECIASLPVCWPSLVGLGNQMRGCVFLLEGVSAEEIDLVGGVISCNGPAIVVYVMYFAC